MNVLEDAALEATLRSHKEFEAFAGRSGHYVLDRDGNPQPEPNLLVWGMWLETANEQRRVDFTDVGPAQVSTVFLGLDYSFSISGRRRVPILWETMVFWKDHELDLACTRYSSREEAQAGHDAMVTRVRVAQEPLRAAGGSK